MKKRFLGSILAIVLIASLALAAGCGSTGPKGTSSALNGSITVAGSTSVQPFSEALAEEFNAENTGATVNVQGGGSTQGITAAKSGAANIGASSRELKPEEKAGLKEFTIARDGIAVIVNPANKISNLTLVQLKGIYSGQIVNWKEVGGKDAKITVVSREAGSGTRGGFEDIVMKKTPITNKAVIQSSTGSIVTTVANDPNAIGYASMASVNSTVLTVAVEGTKPSEDTVAKNQYKISRPFIYVTKGEPTGIAKAFIDYVLSEQGQEVLAQEGAVRVK